MIGLTDFPTSRWLPTLKWLRAIAVLAVIAVASAGSSARVGGEMNAVMQSPGARTMALALFATTPLLLALRQRLDGDSPESA